MGRAKDSLTRGSGADSFWTFITPSREVLGSEAGQMRRVLVLCAFLLTQIGSLRSALMQGPSRGVTQISYDGKEFIAAFNAAADRTRLVLIFSPT